MCRLRFCSSGDCKANPESRQSMPANDDAGLRSNRRLPSEQERAGTQGGMHEHPKQHPHNVPAVAPGSCAMSGASGIGRFRTDRTILLALLGLLAALCWAYLLFHVGRMAAVGTGTAVHAAPYRLPDLGLLYALWVVVIAAM